MAVQALREDAPHNPRTVDEARALVKRVEGLFMPWNIDALVDGFTKARASSKIGRAHV